MKDDKNDIFNIDKHMIHVRAYILHAKYFEHVNCEFDKRTVEKLTEYSFRQS